MASSSPANARRLWRTVDHRHRYASTGHARPHQLLRLMGSKERHLGRVPEAFGMRTRLVAGHLRPSLRETAPVVGVVEDALGIENANPHVPAPYVASARSYSPTLGERARSNDV